MVSISCFKSSSIQHHVHFVKYGPIYFKIDDKERYALGRGYLVIDRSLLRRAVTSFSAAWKMSASSKVIKALKVYYATLLWACKQRVKKCVQEIEVYMS